MSDAWRFERIPDTATLPELIRVLNLQLRDLSGALASVPLSCYGDPEGSIEGNIGDLCVRLDGGVGTTLYAKESGAAQTLNGWTAK